VIPFLKLYVVWDRWRCICLPKRIIILFGFILYVYVIILVEYVLKYWKNSRKKYTEKYVFYVSAQPRITKNLLCSIVY